MFDDDPVEGVEYAEGVDDDDDRHHHGDEWN